MAYTTFISVNRKSVKITISDNEHNQKIRQLRAADYARKQDDLRKMTNQCQYQDASVICPGCGDKKISNYQSRNGNWICKHCGWTTKNYTNGPKI